MSCSRYALAQGIGADLLVTGRAGLAPSPLRDDKKPIRTPAAAVQLLGLTADLLTTS
jgi:hypothetical protein